MKLINRNSLLLILAFTLLAVEVPTNASSHPCVTATVEVDKPFVQQGDVVTVTLRFTSCDTRFVRNVDADLFVYYACPDSEGGDYMEYGDESVVRVRRKIKLEVGATETEEVTFIAPAPVPCGNYVACLWLTTPHEYLGRVYGYFTVTG